MAPGGGRRTAAVRFEAGSGYELLASIGAVAEDRWRSVLTHGAQIGNLALRERGPGWVRRVGAFGRFGWINLYSLLIHSPPPHTAQRCLAILAATDAEAFHLTALGMRRRQLRALVSDEQAVAAVRGDRAARLVVRRAAASDQTILSVNRWLLTSRSEHVHDAAVELLTTWADTLRRGWEESRLDSLLAAEVTAQRKRARATPPVEVIRDVSGGLVYAPKTASRRTVLAPAPAVDPAVIVVDDLDADLIVYCPRADDPPMARDRLLLMSRALGDDTRLQLLAILREGQQTATALARRLDTPRTTLIHHLALLRSAGLIHTDVTGNATYYTLRRDAPDALNAALREFFAPTERT